METESISQYVIEVLEYSSQLSNDDNCANNVRGQPKALNSYGKKTQCWSPASFNAEEYLIVKFEKPVFATEIKIYENYNAGSVTKIEVFNGNTYETLWSRQRPQLITQYTVFNPKFQKSNIRSNQYLIRFTYLPSQTDYSQIDSIELIGTLTNIYATDKCLADDIPKLLNDDKYCDITIKFQNENNNLKAHRNILSCRCPQILDLIDKNNNFITELTLTQFSVVLDYIYTDQLNVTALNNVFEEEQLMLKDSEEWILCINKLIRFTIKYKFTVLESLLVNLLIETIINNDNVLIILVDTFKGQINARQIDDTNINLNDIYIDLVQFSCLEYIGSHISEIFESEKINLIPKDILLKIIDSIANELK